MDDNVMKTNPTISKEEAKDILIDTLSDTIYDQVKEFSEVWNIDKEHVLDRLILNLVRKV